MKIDTIIKIVSLNLYLTLLFASIDAFSMQRAAATPLQRPKTSAHKELLAKMLVQRKQLVEENTFKGHPEFITNLVMNDNGDVIASSCKGTINNLIIWDRKTKEKLREISIDATIDEIYISPDGNSAIIACYKNNDADNIALYLFNTKDKKEGILLPVQKYRSTPVCCLSDLLFSSDSRYFVYQLYNENIAGYHTNIFDITANKLIQAFRTEELLQFTFNPKKNEIAVLFKDRISTYSLAPFEKSKDLTLPTKINLIGSEYLFYSNDGSKIILDQRAIENGHIFIWNEKGILFNPETIHKTIYDSQFTLDNKAENFVAYATKKGQPIHTIAFDKPFLAFYSIKTNEEMRAIAMETLVYPLSFSPNNKFVMGYSREKSIDNIAIWQTDTGNKFFDISIDTKKYGKNIAAWAPNTSKSIIDTHGYRYAKDENSDDIWSIPLVAFSKNSQKIATSITVPSNIPDKMNCIFSVYDIHTSQRLYHSENNCLFAADSNFDTIVFVDKNNPTNFLLKSISKASLSTPSAEEQPAVKTQHSTTIPTKQTQLNTVPATSLVTPALQTRETATYPQIQTPQTTATSTSIAAPVEKTWRQWLFGG